MIHSGRKNVTSATVPEPLVPSSTAHISRMASWVTVIADKDNSGYVYIGDSTTTNASGGYRTYVGHPLSPGDFLNLRELGGATYLDLSGIYVAVDSSGGGVTYNYGIR